MRKFLTITMVCVGLLLSSTSYAYHDTQDKTAETYKYMQLFQRIFEIIRQEHVDPVNDKEILEAAIRGMVSKLDKHSSYLNVEEAEGMRQGLRNKFVGLGIDIVKDEKTGFIKVISPIDGTPAFIAGVKEGDLITEVNGVELKSKTLRESVKFLRGPRNTTAILKIIRDDKPLTVEVVRNVIILVPVRHRVLPHDIGYIRLSQFSENIATYLNDAIVSLKEELSGDRDFKGLVLDLRNNPGGLLKGAIKVTDLFVKHGVIVLVRYRDVANHSRTWNAKPHIKLPLSIPVVVLINSGSASASEIVAGSLQDLGRATIVGVQSYGKGSVQTLMAMPTGGVLRLTRAKYYTASGRVIHGVGITPDVIIEMPKEYKRKSRDDIDPQLQKAIEVILLENEFY